MKHTIKSRIKDLVLRGIDTLFNQTSTTARRGTLLRSAIAIESMGVVSSGAAEGTEGAVKARTKMATVGARQFAYRTIGKGSPVIFLHRFRGTMDDWDPAFVDAVAADHQVILFDNTGVSSSPGEVPTTLSAAADDAVVFARGIGITKAAMLGWSMGGLTAQEVVIRYPEFTTEAIIIGVSVAAFTNQTAAIKKFHEDKDNDLAKIEATSVPLLILNGNQDIANSVENWYALGGKARSAEIHVFPDAAHASLHQYPERAAEVINNFIRAHEGIDSSFKSADTAKGAPTQFIEANGIRFAYRRFGKSGGTPLVFLQYLNANMDGWDPTVINGFAAEREVILFNNAGVASSGGETPDTVSEMTKNLVAFVGALGLKEIDVVGFSLGGMIAQQLALDYPKLVRRIILLGTAPRGGEGLTFNGLSAYEAKKDPEAFLLAALFAPTDTSQAAGKALLRRLKAREIDRDLPVSVSSREAQIRALKEWGTIPSADRYATLKKIKQPVLIVHGNHDIVVSPLNALILVQQLPNAQLMIYPDSGHGAHDQYAEAFLHYANLFLNALDQLKPRGS